MEEKDIELIDKYLSGALSESEQKSFHERLEQERDFAELYEDMRYLQKGLQQAELQKAWEVIQLAEAGIAHPGVGPGGSSQWKVWLSVAASFAFLLVAAWFFLMRTSNPQELYAQYFEVYPNVEAPIYRDSGAVDTLTIKDLGFRRYADEDYEGAIGYFESIAQADEGTKFYLGMSYLAKGDARQATAIWEPLSKEAVDYKTQIQWYLALAWLKMEELEKARGVLEGLAISGTAYAERSKEILKAL